MGGIPAQAILNRLYQECFGEKPYCQPWDYAISKRYFQQEIPGRVIYSDFEPHEDELKNLDSAEKILILGHHQPRGEMESYQQREGVLYFNPRLCLEANGDGDKGVPISYLISQAAENLGCSSPILTYIGLRSYGFLKHADDYARKNNLRISKRLVDSAISRMLLYSSYRISSANEVVESLSSVSELQDLIDISGRYSAKKLERQRNLEIGRAIINSHSIREAPGVQVFELETKFESVKPHIYRLADAGYSVGNDVAIISRQGNSKARVSIRSMRKGLNVGMALEEFFSGKDIPGTEWGGHESSGSFACEISDLDSILENFVREAC